MSSFFNFTIQSSSPLISYFQTPGWSQFSSQASSTSQAEFYHIAQDEEANFEFIFQGSAIQLFGSANCSYDITLDGVQFPGLTAEGSNLFNVSNLSSTNTHTIRLEAYPDDLASTSLSFEKAVIFTPATNVTIQTVPTPPLQYSPQWSTNSTTHFTSTLGDFAEWNFTGINAVEIQGSLGSDHGLYEVSLNNVVTTYNASSSSFVPMTTKFYAGGLNENGTHTLRITNVQNGGILTVSEVLAYTMQNVPIADQDSVTSTSTSHSNDHKLMAIVAPIIAVVLFLILCTVYVFIRRRRRMANLNNANHVVPFANFRTSMSVKSRFGDWEVGNPFKRTKAPTTALECAQISGAPRKIGLPQNPRALLPPGKV